MGVSQACLRVRLGGQVIDRLGLLAAHEVGEVGFLDVQQVATLNAHRLIEATQVGRPAARRRDPHDQIPCGRQVLAQVAAHETRCTRHQSTHKSYLPLAWLR